jgi:phage shock protein PspC (stress-responsive transcriptional regulator)
MADAGDPIERAYRPPSEAPGPLPAEAVVVDLRLVRLHLVVLAVAMAILVVVTALMQAELLDPAPQHFSADGYNELFSLHALGSFLLLVPVLLGVLPMLVLPSQLGLRFPAWVSWPALVAWGMVTVPWWTRSVLDEPAHRMMSLLLLGAALSLHAVGLVLAVIGGGRAALARAPLRCAGLVLGGAGVVAYTMLSLVLPVLDVPAVPNPELTEMLLPVIVVVAAGLVERHAGVAVSGVRFSGAFALMIVGVWGSYALRLTTPLDQAWSMTGTIDVALIPVMLYLIGRLARSLGRAPRDPATVALALALVSLTAMTLVRRFLGTLSPDVHLHDTYFAVAPLHFTGAAAVLLLVAACFQAAPALFGRAPRRALGILGALALGGGMLISFTTMALLGQQGMPRRYYTYVPQFQGGFEWMGIGAAIAAVGLVMVVLAIGRGSRSNG